MPQQVPEFRFSDDALRVRQYLYEFWCENGRGPNLRRVHEATGLSRARLLDVYRELDLGMILTIDQETQNANILKMQPFASFPSQVEVWIDDRFHCWAGCAMEAMALPSMPPLVGRAIRYESYCVCCLAPVRLEVAAGGLRPLAGAAPLIHVSKHPREWNTTHIIGMCDSMNFVLDAEHAAAYERSASRRGVLFTIEQARRFVAATADARMHRYDWEPAYVRPERIVAGIKAIGVDVSPWGA